MRNCIFPNSDDTDEKRNVIDINERLYSYESEIERESAKERIVND